MSEDQLSLKISNLLDVCLSKPEMTVDKLCVGLNIKRQSLWNWRKGKTLPRVSSIKKICEIGAVDYNTFVTSTEDDPVTNFVDIESLIKNYRSCLQNYPMQTAYYLHLCAAYVVENLRSAGLYTKTVFQDFPPTSKSANCTITINFKDADFFDLSLSVYGDLENIYIKCFRQTSNNDDIFYCEPLNEENIKQFLNLIQQTI